VSLSLATRHEGDYTIIECRGELDIETVPRLREQFADLIADGHCHLVVDLQGLEFLDSTGLGVLVGGFKRVEPQDGSLQLVCTQERILKLFNITGLINVFSIHATVNDALHPDH
jgi:anti-sigma B factor antagonist